MTDSISSQIRAKIRGAVSNTLAETLVKVGSLDQPQEQVTMANALPIPFAIATSPNSILHLIVHNQDPEICTPKLREMLTTWLEQYDTAMSEYLKSHYGPESIEIADQIIRQVLVAQARYMAMQQHPANGKSDEVSDLEKHFGMDSAPEKD